MPEVDKFLEKIVNDFTLLKQNVIVSGDKKINVCVDAFICDAPVRADLKRIMNHNRYNSCERCVQRGKYARGHVTLLDTNSLPRTDQDFIDKVDEFHHKPGPVPIIQQMNIGFVSQFCLDYMHLVCLGIMKRLLCRWKSSRKADIKCHLSNDNREELELSISFVSKFILSDFVRKLSGGLRSFSFWKATEFRLFLFYVVLEDVLPEVQFKKKIEFVCAYALAFK